MKRQRPNYNNESGQIMIGFYVGILAVMLILLSVGSYVISVTKSDSSRLYREMAISVAYQGFTDGESFFQRQAGGVYLPVGTRPTGDTWPVTGTVWSWPDDAFQPGTGDTDIYLTVTTGEGGTCAAAIIRDFPLQLSSSSATLSLSLNEPIHGTVWGRYVLRRQSTRNWTPGPNTADANTDVEACHDITLQKTFNAGEIGSGQWWSITSHGYVYLGSGTNNPSISDDISNAASTVGNSVTTSPLATYNGRALLLSNAKVYGEINRISMYAPGAAVFAPAAASITGNSFGDIDSGNGTSSGYDVASGYGGTSASLSTFTFTDGGQAINAGGAGAVSVVASAPSVGVCFPGLSASLLQGKANSAGDVEILPNPNAINFTSQVSEAYFYYLYRPGGSNTTFTFGTNNVAYEQSPVVATVPSVLQGTGLLFVNGSLYVTPGAIASWDGIIFVNGNATISGPTQIYGELICTGSVYVGDPTNKNYATIQYNSYAVANTETLIQNFTVYKPSVVVSYN